MIIYLNTAKLENAFVLNLLLRIEFVLYYYMAKVFLICFLFMFFVATPVFSSVTVFDNVTYESKATMLKMLSGGVFFKDGGVLVDFFIDDNKIGKTLTGSDGYAFMEYKPKNSGLFSIKVVTKEGSNKGLLLVLKSSEEVFLLETGLSDPLRLLENKSLFLFDKNALKDIEKSYKIIYLVFNSGTKVVRQWLRREKYPESVVIATSREEVFEDFKDLGVKIGGFVGSSDLMEECEQFSKNCFTFDEDYDDDSHRVENMEEVIKSLKKD